MIARLATRDAGLYIPAVEPASVGDLDFEDDFRRVRVGRLALEHPKRDGDFVFVEEARLDFRVAVWKDRGRSLERARLRGLEIRGHHLGHARAYGWLDASAYINHVILVRKARTMRGLRT